MNTVAVGRSPRTSGRTRNVHLLFNRSGPTRVAWLTAVPDAGSTFAGWGGGCSGVGTCGVTLNGDRYAFATFTKTPTTVTTTYYHTDVIGSVRAITDQGGATVIRHDYLPFGEDTQPLTGDPVRFGGKLLDPESALYNFEARYYRNTWGRFTQVDPAGMNVGDTQSWNRYTYARNNPLRFIDPNGMQFRSGIDCPSGGAGTSSCPWAPISPPNRGSESPFGGSTGNNWGTADEVCGEVLDANGQTYYWQQCNDGPDSRQIPDVDEQPNPCPSCATFPDDDGQKPTCPSDPAACKKVDEDTTDDAIKRLKLPACGAAYGGLGIPTILNTNYRYLSFQPGKTGAFTSTKTFVVINTNGYQFTRQGTSNTYYQGRVSQTELGGFIKLHELGHQLSKYHHLPAVTFFEPDGGNQKINDDQSDWVINHCF